MNQTIGGANDVSARIGALELGAINSFDDSALESTVHAGPSTRLRNGPVCLNIDDSALEATVHAGPGPSFPPSLPPMCRRIDDGALEASIQVGPGPSGLTRFPTCMPRGDDGALEQAAARVEVGPTNRMVANRCM